MSGWGNVKEVHITVTVAVQLYASNTRALSFKWKKHARGPWQAQLDKGGVDRYLSEGIESGAWRSIVWVMLSKTFQACTVMSYWQDATAEAC